MGRALHIAPVADEANGVWKLANLLAAEAGGVAQTGCAGMEAAGDVWVHGLWLPCEWRACWRALRQGKRLVRMTHGSLSPVYLRRQGRWKKWLVGPIERYFLRKADVVVATCAAEAAWIRAYEPRVKKIEVTDVKRFFDLSRVERVGGEGERALHVLYLGRRHPLKGVDDLEEAVKGVERCTLRVESCVFGAEKEKVWAWCDVLALPTLSENFGLVVAEALERGKRVITTDGAPAWGEELDFRVERLGVSVEEDCGLRGDERNAGEIWSGYGGRLLYLKGYRAGGRDVRVSLLQRAMMRMAAKG